MSWQILRKINFAFRSSPFVLTGAFNLYKKIDMRAVETGDKMIL
jgi:hypothetical protein